MAQVYDKLIVDVRVKRDSIITAVQNDSNSRFLDVYLKDNGLPINLTGHEVRIYCKKPENGGETYNDGEITDAVDGRCQFPLTDQTLAKVGFVEAQIIIYYQNVQILQTMEFKIHVVKSLIAPNAIPSSNEYGALVVLYQNLYEAHDLMTTMVQNIGVPGEIAEQLTIDTMWDAWEYLCNYVSEDLTTLLQNAINNNSVDGVVQRLGNMADTGATATAGTVFAKLNKLINGNEEIKSVMHKSLKVVNVAVPTLANDYTVLNISGAGEYYGSYINTSVLTKAIVIIDGLSFPFENSGLTSAIPNRFYGISLTGSSNSSNQYLESLPFSRSLIVKLSTNAGNAVTSKNSYALYE